MVDFDKAAKEARAKDAARKNGTREEPAPEVGIMEVPGASSMLANPATVMGKLAAGAWEAAPQILKIEEGQTIVGFLEGKGPPAEVKDPATHEIKECDTWILSSLDNTGVRVSILSTAQLEKKLVHFVDGEVSISRGKTFKTASGLQCTEYIVAGPKRADGQRRDWSKPPQLSLPAPGPTS